MQVTVESAHLFRLYEETNARLDHFLRLVAEGKAIDEASSFARWLVWCRIEDLIVSLSRSGIEFLKPVRPDELSRKIKALVALCGDQYQGFKPKPMISGDSLQSMHDKLDLLLSRIDSLELDGGRAVGRRVAPGGGRPFP